MITPIEMYTMVPKSQEASNVRHGEMARDASQQAQVVQNINRQAEANTQRTVAMSEADNPDYRYDAKEKGNNEYSSDGDRKNKKENKDEQESKPVNNSARPGGIDIRI